MDTELLRTFAEVSRRGSLTAASEALGFTQSAVSRQIASLEAIIGVRLLDRRPRGVELTYAGRSLLTHAEEILARWAAARTDLESLGRLETGRLRVGAFPTANATLVPAAMGQLGRDHPSLEISLVEGTTRRQLSMLADGDVDVAVVSAFADQDLDSTRFELLSVVKDPILVAMHHAHRLAGRSRLRLRELSGERWIGEDHSDDRVLSPARISSAAGLEVDFVVREWTARLGLAAAGLGVTLVPRLAAGATRPDLSLIDLHPDEKAVRWVYAASRAGRTRSRPAEEFVGMLRAHARRLWGRQVASGSAP